MITTNNTEFEILKAAEKNNDKIKTNIDIVTNKKRKKHYIFNTFKRFLKTLNLPNK